MVEIALAVISLLFCGLPSPREPSFRRRSQEKRFAFPTQSASSLLVSGKARNIDALRQNHRWKRHPLVLIFVLFFIRFSPTLLLGLFCISNTFVKRSVIKRPYRRKKNGNPPKKQRRILKCVSVYDIMLSTTYLEI